MIAFLGLTKRNLKLYFKDRMSVFFSMMTPIIIFLLYLLFLKGNFVDSIEAACAGLGGRVTSDDIDALVNAFLLAGVLGASMITVSLNNLITIVKDKENKIDYDVSTTPMKRVTIILSYYTASLLSSVFMSAVVLTVGLAVLALSGGWYLGAADVLALYGMILLGSLSATSLFMTVVMLFKSVSATSALMVLVSVAAGFMIGAYIPISSFSTTVQTICNLLPGSGVTVLVRAGLMEGILTHIDAGLGGIDGGAFTQAIRDEFSFHITIGEKAFDHTETVLYVAAWIAVSLIAMALIYPRVYRRR